MSGKDVTIVSSSYSTIEALRAGKILKQFGITFDLFDLRSARPLKLDQVFKSVKKTGSLITVDIGSKILGLGSEIITQTFEKCFDHLKSKPVRIGLPDHPIPSSRGYIPNLYPDSSKIIEAIFEQGSFDKNLKVKALNVKKIKNHYL